MKHGDISNRPAPVIAFRVDEFLLKTKEDTLKDRVLNVLIGKSKRLEINLSALACVQRIFRHTDMTTDLVVSRDFFNPDVEELLCNEFPHDRIILVDKPVEVAIKLNGGDWLYYVDDDTVRNSIIGHTSCMTLEEFNRKVMIGGYRV